MGSLVMGISISDISMRNKGEWESEENEKVWGK